MQATKDAVKLISPVACTLYAAPTKVFIAAPTSIAIAAPALIVIAAPASIAMAAPALILISAPAKIETRAALVIVIPLSFMTIEFPPTLSVMLLFAVRV